MISFLPHGIEKLNSKTKVHGSQIPNAMFSLKPVESKLNGKSALLWRVKLNGDACPWPCCLKGIITFSPWHCKQTFVLAQSTLVQSFHLHYRCYLQDIKNNWLRKLKTAPVKTTALWATLQKLGLQRYIFPRCDTYPDTDVTIRYKIRYVTQQQNASCLARGHRKSLQLTSLVGSTHVFVVSAILNITLNTAQHGFFSSVCSENRHA